MKLPKSLLLVGAMFLIGTALGVRLVMAEQTLEQPGYTVEKVDGNYEYRAYQPYLVAEVTVEGDRSQAANKGFQILAGYIFGGNRSRLAPQQSEKISMTSPVTQQPESKGGWKVRFMMPKKFSLETLPVAQDQRIRFLSTEPERYVTLRFSGGWDEENLARHRLQLQQYASAKQLAVKGEPIYAFYNAPFVPTGLRRNEVLLRLKT